MSDDVGYVKLLASIHPPVVRDEFWDNGVELELMGHAGPESWYPPEHCHRVHVGVPHREWARNWSRDQKKRLLCLRSQI